jgi:TRAP transporter TAXI family solute receptor
MTQLVRYALFSLRDIALSLGPFLLLAVLLLAGAYWMLDPTPPRTVTLATGPDQSAYDEFGKRYAAELKRHHINVVFKASEGSSANLQLLESGQADLAFVQGGTREAQAVDAATHTPLASLGSLFYEPGWVFYREEAAKARSNTDTLAQIADLRGYKIGVGMQGSGVPALFNRLLDANGLEPKDVQLSKLDLTPSVMALLDSSVDALVLVSAAESPMVQMLLATPGIKLLEVVHAQAYARRFNFLSAVTLPRGIVNLKGDTPPKDMALVAATTQLVARDNVHPALIQLFTQAAHTIHSGPGWFQRSGEFPQAKTDEFPLAKEAQRFYREGTPLMQRYLPFWLANLVDRMWVVMGIIVAILLPLSRIIPPLYTFRIRSRIFKWYGQLRAIEQRLDTTAANEQSAKQLLDELNAMDSKVEKIAVPLSYTDELYSLRSNIHLVRKRVLALNPQISGPGDNYQGKPETVL